MGTKTKFRLLGVFFLTGIGCLLWLELAALAQDEGEFSKQDQETVGLDDYFLQQEFIEGLPINLGKDIEVTNYLEPNFTDLGFGGEIETRKGFFNFRARVGATTVQERVTPGNSRLRFIVQNGFSYE